MSEIKQTVKHRLVVDKRENVAISGVQDVISFDEEQVVCETDMGVLILKGQGLHVSSLNLDNGTLDIFGEINAIEYEDIIQSPQQGPNAGQKIIRPRAKSGFISKIFK